MSPLHAVKCVLRGARWRRNCAAGLQRGRYLSNIAMCFDRYLAPPETAMLPASRTT
jgi:hypothetical protein